MPSMCQSNLQTCSGHANSRKTHNKEMNNQKLTSQQKHVIHTQTWNENNSEFFAKQNKLRSKKTYLKMQYQKWK